MAIVSIYECMAKAEAIHSLPAPPDLLVVVIINGILPSRSHGSATAAISAVISRAMIALLSLRHCVAFCKVPIVMIVDWSDRLSNVVPV